MLTQESASASSQIGFEEEYVAAERVVSPTTLTTSDIVTTRPGGEESSAVLGCGAL
ncbi:hypothetical protein Tdes44962_MAKER01769 [Teratosphaeria destructans]|uniref:Uncharacterized protein n=1 Tax=Teratosphaeria destructans TaxID=418781 RepID=A0A9W7W520_9PEZI|nr:hypothetical protein Tdes44962_MAKER01769 [Teratosphaeria destructans]